MDRTILVTFVVFLVLTFYEDEVLAYPHYDTSFATKEKESDNKMSTEWFTPRLGRRKRNVNEDTYGQTGQELAYIMDDIDGYATALYSGYDKLICKNMQGKRNSLCYIPRLERNLENVSENRWLQDIDYAKYILERSPPFAPRLGRRFSPYSPRLGRLA